MAMMTSAEVSQRLGVKLETVYAYVSRGVLTRQRDPAGRTSRFDDREVEALARRGRPRRTSRSTVFEIDIETGLTSIDSGGLRFRGRDAVELARSVTFEQVATLLWTGRLPEVFEPWSGRRVGVLQGGDLLDRIRIAVALAATHDASRADLRPEGVALCGRALIASVVDSLPPAGDGHCPRLVLAGGRPLRSTVAGRLWSRLVTGRSRPELVEALNAALVLLVDHELAASTFAARIAASVRADPYAVVATGLGPLSGPFHGRASRAVRQLLDRAAASPGGGVDAAFAALGALRRLPGFGHPLYPEGDPRAAALLELLRNAASGTRSMEVSEAVVAAVRRRGPVQPNIDFAVATLSSVAGMPGDAGEAIFAVARMAGWLAHAIEEYGSEPARFRPRATYVAGQVAGRPV
jgi:citrate synthase